MNISDILTLFGIFVAVVIGVVGIVCSRRSLKAAMIGIRLARESLEVARLAYLAQVKEPVLKAFAAISGDWPTSTITVTNTGDDHFSVSGILIDVNGDGVTVESPTIDNKDFDKFPKLLIRRAAIKFTFCSRTVQGIPVNVRTRIVLKLSEGTRLTCDGVIFAQEHERHAVS